MSEKQISVESTRTRTNMKKNQIIFFESIGFGWVITDKVIRKLGLSDLKGRRISETPMEHLTLRNVGHRMPY